MSKRYQTVAARIKHRDEQRAYAATHREETRLKDRARYAERPQEKRAYHAAHREEILPKMRAYGATHRGEKAARNRAYNAAHPEEKRVRKALWKALRRGLAATLTVEEWRAILEAHGHKCAYCGEPYEEIDHVIPLSAGGPTTKENVVPACQPCNLRKGKKVLGHWWAGAGA